MPIPSPVGLQSGKRNTGLGNVDMHNLSFELLDGPSHGT